ncbi:MAG: amidohydrolase, partial [Calditrichaeota bacterium]
MKQLVTANQIYYKGNFQSGLGILVENGEIKKVGQLEEFKEAEQELINFPGKALLPGTINAHNHSFQSLVRGFGDDMNFFDWRDKGIYKYSLDLGPEEIYVGALFAFGEMLTYGVTTVCDFFYLHDQGNENSRAVIRAAKDLGIRLVLARTFYDWEVGPAKYRESIDDASRRCHELMDEFENDPMITICPAPHSPHAASPEMIKAGYQVAVARNTPFHIHVAEGQYEVKMISEKYGLTPMRYLEDLGVCSERMVAVHC